VEIDILSLFPEYFNGPFDVSMIGRARKSGTIRIDHVDVRRFATDKHAKVDDRPYGGGPGMVLKPDPVVAAIRSVRKEGTKVVYLSPQGKKLTAAKCRKLAKTGHLVLLCGHYEGVDERALELEVDEEISIGDYVLTSGAPAAIVLVDSVVRFIPGVIGCEESFQQDSFENGQFDTAHYTRPPEFEGLKVPDVLLGGNHAEIEKWRHEIAREKTERVRPDLVKLKE
jgi:tRNA (guanine37-N1)-methyltransferase